MYRQFNIQQFYVLPTQCIYVFCVDLRTNSHYFPTHQLTGPLGDYTKLRKLTFSVMCARPSFRMEQLCPHWTDFHGI